MTFTQAVRAVLSKYVTFSGRAPRSEYWWFYLFTILVSIATGIVDALLNTAFDNQVGIVGTSTSLALLLPTLAVTVRRLHDTGRTGLWILFPVVSTLTTVVMAFATVFAVGFSTARDRSPAVALVLVLVACVLITFAACITLLVFLCLGSNPGPNKYGHPPTGSALPPAPAYGQPYGYPQQHPAAPGPYPPQP